MRAFFLSGHQMMAIFYACLMVPAAAMAQDTIVSMQFQQTPPVMTNNIQSVGDYAISVLPRGDMMALDRDKEGRKVEKKYTTLSVVNDKYDQKYSATSEKFVNKIKITNTSGDYNEAYVIDLSSPVSGPVIYKIDRTIDYPNPMARPRDTEVIDSFRKKWGEAFQGRSSYPYKPNETMRMDWYYRKDGSQLPAGEKCPSSLGDYVTEYSFNFFQQAKQDNQSNCSVHILAQITFGENMYVSKIHVSLFNNEAFYLCLQNDFDFLDKNLNSYLDANVVSRRRILAPPKL